MITVCILSRDPYFTSETVEFLRKYFRVRILSLNFYSFSAARNLCRADTEFIMRLDTDERFADAERALVAIKRDVLNYKLIFAKILNVVGKYRWYGWKLVIYPSDLKYVGSDHEVLYIPRGDDLSPHEYPRIYDDDIEIENVRTERQYMLSLARSYYFGYRYDRDWFELRRIIGNVTVPRFYDIMKSPPEELKKWAEKHISCDPGRGFYYYIFESYPNECYLDPPFFEKIANEVYNKVRYYDSYLPYYYAEHKDLNLDEVARLNRIYMHVFGRPVDHAGLEAYLGKPAHEVIKSMLLSVWNRDSS